MTSQDLINGLVETKTAPMLRNNKLIQASTVRRITTKREMITMEDWVMFFKMTTKTKSRGKFNWGETWRKQMLPLCLTWRHRRR